MKPSRFSAEQMVAILRGVDSGSTSKVARQHKITEQTIYRRTVCGVDMKKLALGRLGSPLFQISASSPLARSRTECQQS
jgi:hypothetical protein